MNNLVSLNTFDLGKFKEFLYLKRGYSQGGIQTAIKNFNQVRNYFIEKNLPLTKEAVAAFFLSKKEDGYKNSSLNNYRTSIRLVELFTNTKLLDGIKSFPRFREIPNILTTEEIESILATDIAYGHYQGKDTSRLNFVYKTLILFIALTGCRISEAVYLKVKHIFPGAVIFVQTKNKTNRKVPLAPLLNTRINQLIKGQHGERYVFRSMNNFHVAIPEFEKDLKTRAKLAGIKKRIYPHLFRHSFITTMIESGADLISVANLVGHGDLASTAYYTHLTDTALRRTLYRHPLVQLTIKPHEIISAIKSSIESFRLDEDYRFNYTLTENKKGMQFSLQATENNK